MQFANIFLNKKCIFQVLQREYFIKNAAFNLKSKRLLFQHYKYSGCIYQFRIFAQNECMHLAMLTFAFPVQAGLHVSAVADKRCVHVLLGLTPQVVALVCACTCCNGGCLRLA